ncbi:MAG: hypothetical protein IPK82_26085 [Polyangiaceae bacterium]|nr:hypothetical protein [Polyangiaceae bacterium]
MLRSRLIVTASTLSLFAASGCESPTDPPPTDTVYTLTTDEVTVPPGEEKYLCYAQTLDRDLAIDKFTYTQTAAVHHLLLAKNTVPDPDGTFECDVLFKSSWIPLFGAGNGDAELAAPEGYGHILPKGTQLLVQLHLLNSSSTEVKTPIKVDMREVEGEVKPIGLYAFGTNDINLPAGKQSGVYNDCTVEHDVSIFAWWPHMHKLGTRLTLEVGPDSSSLEEVYRIDPWDFDNQTMEAKTLTIPKGSVSRVTCQYDNSLAEDVTFGESSNNEMCFLNTFATGVTEELDGCVYLKPVGTDPVPPDPAAGVCGEQQANSLGIGAECTQGGGECAAGLTCSLDQSPEPPGFCMKIGGCDVTADCGGDWATCCAPKEAGGLINICIPEACRPADCIPQ